VLAKESIPVSIRINSADTLSIPLRIDSESIPQVSKSTLDVSIQRDDFGVSSTAHIRGTFLLRRHESSCPEDRLATLHRVSRPCNKGPRHAVHEFRRNFAANSCSGTAGAVVKDMVCISKKLYPGPRCLSSRQFLRHFVSYLRFFGASSTMVAFKMGFYCCNRDCICDDYARCFAGCISGGKRSIWIIDVEPRFAGSSKGK